MSEWRDEPTEPGWYWVACCYHEPWVDLECDGPQRISRDEDGWFYGEDGATGRDRRELADDEKYMLATVEPDPPPAELKWWSEPRYDGWHWVKKTGEPLGAPYLQESYSDGWFSNADKLGDVERVMPILSLKVVSVEWLDSPTLPGWYHVKRRSDKHCWIDELVCVDGEFRPARPEAKDPEMSDCVFYGPMDVPNES